MTYLISFFILFWSLVNADWPNLAQECVKEGSEQPAPVDIVFVVDNHKEVTPGPRQDLVRNVLSNFITSGLTTGRDNVAIFRNDAKLSKVADFDTPRDQTIQLAKTLKFNPTNDRLFSRGIKRGIEYYRDYYKGREKKGLDPNPWYRMLVLFSTGPPDEGFGPCHDSRKASIQELWRDNNVYPINIVMGWKHGEYPDSQKFTCPEYSTDIDKSIIKVEGWSEEETNVIQSKWKEFLCFYPKCRICREKFDVVMAVDTSGSIGNKENQGNWVEQKNFVSEFMLKPWWQPTDRAAVLRFGTDVDVIQEFNTGFSFSIIAGKVARMEYKNPGDERTNTLAALDKAISMFDEDPTGNNKVIVFVTDGKPDCDHECDPCALVNVKATKEKLMRNKVTVLVALITLTDKDLKDNKEILRCMTGSHPENLVELKNFEDWDKFELQWTEFLCQGQDKDDKRCEFPTARPTTLPVPPPTPESTPPPTPKVTPPPTPETPSPPKCGCECENEVCKMKMDMMKRGRTVVVKYGRKTDAFFINDFISLEVGAASLTTKKVKFRYSIYAKSSFLVQKEGQVSTLIKQKPIANDVDLALALAVAKDLGEILVIEAANK